MTAPHNDLPGTGDNNREGGGISMPCAHTPGPWRVKRGGQRFWVLDSEDNRVCSISEWTKQVDRADAYLIAAAPDQHAAGVEIDRLLLVIESAVRNAEPAHSEAVLAALKANRAALAKATEPPHG